MSDDLAAGLAYGELGGGVTMQAGAAAEALDERHVNDGFGSSPPSWVPGIAIGRCVRQRCLAAGWDRHTLDLYVTGCDTCQALPRRGGAQQFLRPRRVYGPHPPAAARGSRSRVSKRTLPPASRHRSSPCSCGSRKTEVGAARSELRDVDGGRDVEEVADGCGWLAVCSVGDGQGRGGLGVGEFDVAKLGEVEGAQAGGDIPPRPWRHQL